MKRVVLSSTEDTFLVPLVFLPFSPTYFQRTATDFYFRRHVKREQLHEQPQNFNLLLFSAIFFPFIPLVPLLASLPRFLATKIFFPSCDQLIPMNPNQFFLPLFFFRSPPPFPSSKRLWAFPSSSTCPLSLTEPLTAFVPTFGLPYASSFAGNMFPSSRSFCLLQFPPWPPLDFIHFLLQCGQ